MSDPQMVLALVLRRTCGDGVVWSGVSGVVSRADAAAGSARPHLAVARLRHLEVAQVHVAVARQQQALHLRGNGLLPEGVNHDPGVNQRLRARHN